MVTSDGSSEAADTISSKERVRNPLLMSSWNSSSCGEVISDVKTTTCVLSVPSTGFPATSVKAPSLSEIKVDTSPLTNC